MKTTILYRKLGNEPLASGDGFFNTAGEFQRYYYEYWVGKPNGFIISNDKSPTFRPITVTEPEAPQPKPVEPPFTGGTETYLSSFGGPDASGKCYGHVWVSVGPGVGPEGEVVCSHPTDTACGDSLKHWPTRAKRIIAGQEALKFLDTFVRDYPGQLDEYLRNTFSGSEHPASKARFVHATAILNTLK